VCVICHAIAEVDAHYEGINVCTLVRRRIHIGTKPQLLYARLARMIMEKDSLFFTCGIDNVRQVCRAVVLFCHWCIVHADSSLHTKLGISLGHCFVIELRGEVYRSRVIRL
jgi:hypothetical protein